MHLLEASPCRVSVAVVSAEVSAQTGVTKRHAGDAARLTLRRLTAG